MAIRKKPVVHPCIFIRRVIPALSLLSAGAHLWMSATSSGAMRMIMIAGGLACMVCALHPVTSRTHPQRAAVSVIVMTSVSMLVHMGLITLHASGGGHHHHGQGQVASVHASNHMKLMLALIVFELLILLTTSVAVSRLRGSAAVAVIQADRPGPATKNISQALLVTEGAKNPAARMACTVPAVPGAQNGISSPSDTALWR